MSRSKKKNPFCGHTTAKSEKEDKRIANRKDRRVNKEILKTDQDDSKLKSTNETSNVWSMDKDGKQRFDPERNPKEMRK